MSHTFGRGQSFLYCILTSLIGFLHFFILTSTSPKKLPPPKKKLQIKMAGSPQKKHQRGVFQKLQTNDKSLFQADFVKKAPPHPIKAKPPIKKVKTTPKTSPFDLSDLGYRPVPEAPSIKYQNKNILRFIEENQLLKKLSQEMQSLDLRSLSSGVQIELPKGKSLDKLNSLERKFYSFQLRTYKAYVRSLLNQAYQRQTPANPFPFVKRPTRLIATVSFDKKGNLLRIQTREMGSHQDLQDVFLASLDDIRVLPNPPREILDENGEFSINFILQIVL